MDCRIKSGNDEWAGRRLKSARRGIGARSVMQNLQSAARRFRHHRLCLDYQREPPRGAVAAGADRARGHLRAGAVDAESAADPSGVQRHQQRRRSGRRGDQGRHCVRVRLCRRRRAAVRRQDAGSGIHPRLPGAAGGAGDQRAVVAVVLLADHAADRARLFLGAGKNARRRRRRRPRPPRPAPSSARSRRLCSSGRISPSSRAAKCSSS